MAGRPLSRIRKHLVWRLQSCNLSVLICIIDEPPKEFAFDYSFWSHDQSRNFATQETVFEALGQDVLTNAFKGMLVRNPVFAHCSSALFRCRLQCDSVCVRSNRLWQEFLYGIFCDQFGMKFIGQISFVCFSRLATEIRLALSRKSAMSFSTEWAQTRTRISPIRSRCAPLAILNVLFFCLLGSVFF